MKTLRNIIMIILTIVEIASIIAVANDAYMPYSMIVMVLLALPISLLWAYFLVETFDITR